MDKYEELSHYAKASIESIIGEKVCLSEFPKIFVTDNETMNLDSIKVESDLGTFDFDDAGRNQVYLVKINDFYYFLRIPYENAYKFNIYDSGSLNYVLKTSISISLLPCLIPVDEKGTMLFKYTLNLPHELVKKFKCPKDTFHKIQWVLRILKGEE